MSFGGNGVGKKRKVFYDDHNGIFKTESAIEMLKRQCKYSQKMANVLNRSEEARLRVTSKSVDAGRQIFEVKSEKDRMMYKENLRDYLAYIQVLENISREREKTIYDDKFGKYGPGVSRLELESEIQQQLREMSPTVIRKRNANLLLSQRKKMEVFNRNLKTPELLALRRNQNHQKPKSSSADSIRRSKLKEHKEAAKLILPPITVTLSKQDSKVKFSGQNSPTDDKEVGACVGAEDKTVLPSVFVTQLGP